MSEYENYLGDVEDMINSIKIEVNAMKDTKNKI
jgi:hypothetical protein